MRRSFVIFLLSVLALASCTKTVYVPQTRTEYVNRERVDSLFVHDSVFVTERIKGDTVYLFNDRWHTEYRDRFVTDTVIVHDSISYPVEKEVVRVEYKTPGIMKILALFGILSLVFCSHKLWARFGIR